MTYWKKFNHHLSTMGTSKSQPTVLGFSAYFHDSSAAIIQGGKIIAAAEEERFSRQKHDSGFPERAIKYCLDQANTLEVDAVVYYEDPDEKWERIRKTLAANPQSQTTQDRIINLWQDKKSKQSITKKFRSVSGLDSELMFLDHHLSHAASSYLLSGFNESAIVTIDAVGEKNTTAWGTGRGNNIELKECIEFPDSIGLMYTALTTFLGFSANEDEYKIMGLSAYGDQNNKSNKYYQLIKQLIDQKSDGSFRLNMKYFGHNSFEGPAYTNELADLLGITSRLSGGPITSVHQDISAALQMVTEDVVIKILNYVHSQTNSDNLCLAGGVAYNSVLNGKILQLTPFKKLFIQPAAGDSGSALGAAKYIQYQLDPKAPAEHMSHSYWGPSFTDHEVQQYLDDTGINYTKFGSNSELSSTIADLLSNNKIVGWFQGAMEWGPRGLGHRSILASPLHEEMRDILNSKVKHREMFRPFAPVVCQDDAHVYFEIDDPIPEPANYMLMVCNVKKDKRKLLPAITHIDGSARPQIVNRNQNSLIYELIKKFGKLTGVPILVNTSFNVAGEPIVCSPADAYKCMMSTDIDYMVVGKYMIERSKNIRYGLAT